MSNVEQEAGNVAIDIHLQDGQVGGNPDEAGDNGVCRLPPACGVTNAPGRTPRREALVGLEPRTAHRRNVKAPAETLPSNEQLQQARQVEASFWGSSCQETPIYVPPSWSCQMHSQYLPPPHPCPV